MSRYKLVVGLGSFVNRSARIRTERAGPGHRPAASRDAPGTAPQDAKADGHECRPQRG